MRFYNFSLLIFLSFFIFNVEADKVKKPWTVLTFIAGDNDLEPFIDLDLDEMKEGANDTVHVLAFLSTHRPGEKKISKKLVITKNKISQDGGDIKNLDSGNPNTVIQAGLWAIENYPSDKFAIIFWDHGSGSLNRFLGDTIKPWNLIADKIKRTVHKELFSQDEDDRGVCYDDSTGNYLNDFDLQKILETLSKKLGKKVDIVAFDACLMADIELAFTSEPYADYFVASQEVIAGTGYQYKFMLDSLKKRDLSAKSFAKKMVNAYDRCYRASSDDYTLSAVRLSHVTSVVENINTISDLLSDYLTSQSNHSVDKVIGQAAFNDPNLRFDEPDYLDLYGFYLNLYSLIGAMELKSSQERVLKRELRKGLYLIRKSVIEKASSPRFSSTHGISIYFPKRKIHSSYAKLHWSLNTKWLNFLQNYFKAK